MHTYWVSRLRLVLDAQLQGGKTTSAAHSLPGLKALLERLPPTQRLQLVRGDCAVGTERVMTELESLQQPYLFKLRQSAGVKKLVERQWRRAAWTGVGQGWFACAEHLQLMG